MTQVAHQTGADGVAIRPFHVSFPESELIELRRRVNATRFPERETVADDSQGVQLATVQALVHYWATDYDWRKAEARLKAVPQFLTEIEGLDIHEHGMLAYPEYVIHGYDPVPHGVSSAHGSAMAATSLATAKKLESM